MPHLRRQPHWSSMKTCRSQLKGLLMGFNQGEQANTADCFILSWLALHDVTELALRLVKKKRNVYLIYYSFKWISIWPSLNIWMHMSNCSVFQYSPCDVLSAKQWMDHRWQFVFTVPSIMLLTLWQHITKTSPKKKDTWQSHGNDIFCCRPKTAVGVRFIRLLKMKTSFLPQLYCPTFGVLS